MTTLRNAMDDLDYWYEQEYGYDPLTRPTVEVTILTDENATVAAITLWDAGTKVTYTGSSKRAPGDVRDEDAGRQLALGRALLKLGASLVQAGNR